jgi:proline dehydrogenase
MKRFLINLLPDRIAWFFSRPYVAGDSMTKALIKVDELWKQQKYSSVDLLGEAVSTKEEVETMVKIYLELIEALKEKSHFASISLKPTALGVKISKEYCLTNLRTILTAAQKFNIAVTMDMEDSSLTAVTLELYSILKADFPSFGAVLQSRLFRTAADIDNNLPPLPRVRLCIGIYLEPASIALTKKADMKKKLIEYAEKIFDKNGYVEIATHDERVIREVLALVERKKITVDQVEFQFLLGVPRDRLHQELMQKGYKVRLYTPFSTHWRYGTAYVKRRFMENPHMGVYVAKNMLGSKSFQFLLLLAGLIGFILLLSSVASFKL